MRRRWWERGPGVQVGLGFLRAVPGKGIALTRGNNPYSSFGATLVREDEKNLWSMPRDVSHTEADDDRILYNLIVVRNQQAKDSEGLMPDVKGA
ncbi:Melanoregulin, partial [Eschrichtius robustus]|nr:Melanoregulin [Eschrichtius robustus]